MKKKNIQESDLSGSDRSNWRTDLNRPLTSVALHTAFAIYALSLNLTDDIDEAFDMAEVYPSLLISEETSKMVLKKLKERSQ